MKEKSALIDMTTEIVSAYVGNNSVAAEEIPEIIHTIFGALRTVSEGASVNGTAKPTPAVDIESSLTDDYIICLEDGKKFKSLKRHLRTHYDLTPEDYREKWGLSKDYPMVAPNYAKARSKLAKQMGLGQTGKDSTR